MTDSSSRSTPKILITAGPTAEDIDPVRFLTNRSSGRMGMEIAAAALNAGADPVLILGPTPLAPPDNVPVVRVRSAADMAQAVLENVPGVDALVMAAAVADYTPAEPLDAKLKKKDGDLFLRLKRTTDILAAVAASPHRAGKYVVGFSLDVGVNLDEGRRKLTAKKLDCIVVNGVSSFNSDRETAAIVSPDGVEDLGDIAKDALARNIVERIVHWHHQTR